MFRISIRAWAPAIIVCIACAGCAGHEGLQKAPPGAPAEFYTLMAEIARARGEPRVAALAYAAAARSDGRLWPRAATVAARSLQPTLALDAARHWLQQEPNSQAAHLIGADAGLSLYKIAQSAADYRFIVAHSGAGVEASLTALQPDLRAAESPFAARAVADRLAAYFPASAAARQLQGFAALRAADPAAAVRAFTAALATSPAASTLRGAAADARGELIEALRRARVQSGDAAGPLADSLADLQRDGTAAKRFDYAMLLLTAKRNAAARAQLQGLLAKSDAAADARRILGLMDFADGDFAAARAQFAELLMHGHYVDDSLYYLGLIADQGQHWLRALRYFSRVQRGDNFLPAVLRAAAILQAHGAASTADELLDRLIDEDPGSATEILVARAQIYARAHDARRALGILQQAIRQYPDSVDLRYERASIDDDDGHVAAALGELQAILDARPGDPEAMNALGYTLADHARRLGYARKLIERALAEAPQDAAIRDSLGWVRYREGHAERALPLLSIAYADAPGGDIGAHYGEVLWRLGHRAQAERIWLQAAALDPRNRLLRATRQRLQGAAAATAAP
ncbi:MAG TPA: hypothetical protein VMV25_03365 [Steroidobacteraceae bacterium]|nr:hypothetical protein [Steroidobacteraceae bacterium]